MRTAGIECDDGPALVLPLLMTQQRRPYLLQLASNGVIAVQHGYHLLPDRESRCMEGSGYNCKSNEINALY